MADGSSCWPAEPALAIALGPTAAALASEPGPSAGSNSLSGTLYFTRFVTQNYPSANYGGTNDPTNVKDVTVHYDGTTFSVGTPQSIAAVPAADGLAFTPAHSLLVGQNTGSVYNVDPATGHFTAVSAGTPTAFMIGLSPDGNTAYVGSVGSNANGQIGVVGLNPLHTEGTILVQGPDSNVDAIAFANGQAYYTSSLPDAPGDFGKIDLTTGVETQILTGIPAAHGMTYDAYSQTLILTGMNEIAQIDPNNPTQILSSVTVPLAGTGYFDVYDLGWTDGQGHLFAAANDGDLTFVDYAGSGRVGAAKLIQTVHVDSYLDDIIGQLGTSACIVGSTGDQGSTGEDEGTEGSDNGFTASQSTSNGNDLGSEDDDSGSAGNNCKPSCDTTSNSDQTNGTQNGLSGRPRTACPEAASAIPARTGMGCTTGYFARLAGRLGGGWFGPRSARRQRGGAGSVGQPPGYRRGPRPSFGWRVTRSPWPPLPRRAAALDR